MSGKVSKAMVQFGWENICWTNGISGIKKMDEGLPNLGGIEENDAGQRIAICVFTMYQILYLVKAVNKIVYALMKCVVWEIHNEEIKNNLSCELWIVPWIKKMG